VHRLTNAHIWAERRDSGRSAYTRRGHPLKRTLLVNYTLYQVGWFACVLGSAWHRPWTGCLVAVVLLGVHLALARERLLEVRLVLLATAIGAIAEIGQIAAGSYRFTAGTVIEALPPLWLLAMWAQFATTFRYSLRPIVSRPVRAGLFGAAGGPLAFLAGEQLGAVTLLPPLIPSLLRLAIIWAAALTLFSAVVRRVGPEPGEEYGRRRQD
jgi:hypothetical protein